ncbi:hypothetical protein MRB53_038428 [Persea americana]|nr:hypothetical protein MRB53_038428 [Persea americana]
MVEWHEQLKACRTEQKTGEKELADLKANLSNLEARQNQQRNDVQSMRERKEVQEHIELLEAIRPFAEFNLRKGEYEEVVARKNRAEKTYQDLNRQVQPALKAMQNKKDYEEKVKKVKDQRTKLVERTEAQFEETERKLNKLTDDVNDCDKKIAARQNPVEVDLAAYNEKIRAKVREMNDLDQEVRELKASGKSLCEDRERRRQQISKAESDLEALRSQAGQQAQKLRFAVKRTLL